MANPDGSDNPASGATRYPVDSDDVARVLTLLHSDDAVEVEVDAGDRLDRADLELLIRRVHRRQQVAGLLARMPIGDGGNENLLGPSSGMTAQGAVLLAFHVGLEIEAEDIAVALEMPLERAGIALFEARQAIAGKSLQVCDDWRSTIGRYADPGLSRGDIAGLIRHASECENCRQALDEFQWIDDRILAARDHAVLPSQVTGERARPMIHRQNVLLWTPILAVLALAAVGLAGLGFNAGGSTQPVTLLAAGDGAQHLGWLIMSSESEVMAIDLQSGERRRILENPNHDWWNPWIVSPDSQLAVRWEERTLGTDQIGALRAYDMNGELRYLHRWHGPRSRIFSGWLDDRTVLFIERGPVQRAGVFPEISDLAHPAIVAVNLDTGAKREIYRGPVDKAVASPDGRHIALVRPAVSPWPGKTVEVRPVTPDGLGDPVNMAKDRLLSWPGRIIWTPDSGSVYLSLVDESEVPPDLPEPNQPSPGPYDIERIGIAALGIDGSVTEFGSGHESGWAVIQAIAPDNSTLAVIVNPAGERDAEWFYGTYEQDEDRFELSDVGPPGGHWWNSEVVWLPDSETRIVQQLASFQIDGPNPQPSRESLVLLEIEEDGQLNPSVVFHDAMAIGERRGRGLALLGWVSDDAMRSTRIQEIASPQPGTPRQVSQASNTQQLFGDSEVAPTGRHIMLQESYPEEGTLLRLMHMQAWGGTAPRIHDWGEFSWLPRESAAIGTTGIIGRPEQANRLVVLATDRNSPLHGRYLDPAGIVRDTHLRYRRPAVSPNGIYTTFFVQDQREDKVSLWMARWREHARPIQEWEYPSRTRVDARLISKWINHETLIFTAVTDWDDGFPQRISLMRAVVDERGDLEITELRDFRAGGRDAGIDLLEIAVSPNNRNIAFRIRHYSGSNANEDAIDSIHISPASDLTQRVEILRADPGEGMIWAHEEDWLIVGIDNRIALVDHVGRNLTYVTEKPSSFPVLVGDDEVWYQEMTRPWRIMRFPLYDRTV